MEKLREFWKRLCLLKGFEAAAAWDKLRGFGKWLFGMPGLGKRLLFAAPGAFLAVLAFIGMVIAAVVLFVWWWVLPGLVSGAGLIILVWAVCEVSGIIKLGYIAGVLIGLWFYWNVLAAALGTWKRQTHYDEGDYLADAAARVFYGMLVEFGILGLIMGLMEDPVLMLILILAGVAVTALVVTILDLFSL